MSTLLEVKDVCKRYGKKTALDHLNLTLESGHIVGLLGPNGSGKTTLIKLINGILTPDEGEILVEGMKIGVETKKVVSYLPDHTYLNMGMRVRDILDYFEDFYQDFDVVRAYDMLAKLSINPNDKLKSMSKGTKEKVQLILVMSRRADLYVLDEPIAGVDPAATILISTHLIADVENVLDEVVFIQNGTISLTSSVDDIRINQGKSVDALFREVFRC